MRLLSCHIENFGKLCDCTLDFREDLNVIYKENGWGKSTLAAFIRAMFYGFEGERKRKLEENERKRYKPWQGGTFGGQLVFEIQGKQYQITRIFHDKEANDEFELRDLNTNLPSEAYSEKIGEEIFKINRESFSRTIFIGQSACETTATDDINAKIGNLADNSNDLNNYDSAYARLTERLNAMNPNRVTGTISKRKNEIASYERMVNDGKNIGDSIEANQKLLQAEEEKHLALKEQRKQTGEEQALAAKQQVQTARKSEWNRLKQACAEKTERAKSSRAVFPGEIPEQELLRQEISRSSEMDKLSERMRLYQTTNDEDKRLAELGIMFADGIPSDADIEAKMSENASLRSDRQIQSAAQMNAAEKERLAELEPRFSNGTDELNTVMANWNERNSKKATLPLNEATLNTLKLNLEAQKQTAKKFPFLLVCGIIAVIVGAVLAYVLSPIPGIAVALVGVLLALTGVLANRKKTEDVPTETAEQIAKLQLTIDEERAFVARIDAETEAYLRAHGKTFEENLVTAMLQEITTEAVEYKTLKNRQQKENDSTKASECEQLRQEIAAFLGQYHIAAAEDAFAEELYGLKNKAASYRALCEKKESYEQAKGEYAKAQEALSAFLQTYGYEPEEDMSFYTLLNNILDNVKNYAGAKEAAEQAENDLRRFEAQNDMSVVEENRADASELSLEQLNQRMAQLNEEIEASHSVITQYNKELENLRVQFDEWEEKSNKLAELKEKQAAEQAQYDYISMARQKLSEAKEAMTARYAAPILQSFRSYYGLITGQNTDSLHVDANMAVTVDELGKQREVIALSAGYQDIIGICLRVALIDAMYQEERPVIIMDDPFANLDDAKVEDARKFLEQLAGKYQLIYFTCSSMRV